jgi:hypothetical protein
MVTGYSKCVVEVYRNTGVVQVNNEYKRTGVQEYYRGTGKL